MGFRETPRKKARKAGLQTYLSGKPCRHGHSAPRLVCNGKCTECTFPSASKHREYNATWKAKYPGRDQVVKYRYRYGIELDAIRPKPDRCEACNQNHPKIVLDHCHETGAFRGWLCDPCNVVLGLVKDNPERLEQLAEHLRNPEIGSFVNLLKIQANGIFKR